MSQPASYRKRPVVIEAMQLHDDLRAHTTIAEWITSQGGKVTIPALDPHLTIHTLKGDMRADLGDWIIRGVQGEFYPCKPDIFNATYEPAETPTQAPEARLGSSPRAQGLADAEATNAEEAPEDAAQRFARELWALASGLADRNVPPLMPGLPIDAAPVTSALAELDRLRGEVEQWKRLAKGGMDVREQVEEVLDEALGTDEEDGAGQGLAADVALLAAQRDEARAELAKARHALTVLQAARSPLAHSPAIVEQLALAIRARERTPRQIADEEIERGYHNALEGYREVARAILRDIDKALTVNVDEAHSEALYEDALYDIPTSGDVPDASELLEPQEVACPACGSTVAGGHDFDCPAMLRAAGIDPGPVAR